MQTTLNNERYELISTDENELEPAVQSPAPILDTAALGWAQRWTSPMHQREPSEALEVLIDHLWPAPEFSGPFR